MTMSGVQADRTELVEDVQLTEGDVDIPALLHDAADALHPVASRKRLTLTVDTPATTTTIRGDQENLRRVFTILTSNACQYTPDDGAVTLRLWRGEHWLTVEVIDTGVGLTGEDLEHLFTRFYRAKNALTQREGGAGLGLVIARALIGRHGGYLEVESAPGRGSTFRVWLPTQRDPG